MEFQKSQRFQKIRNKVIQRKLQMELPKERYISPEER